MSHDHGTTGTAHLTGCAHPSVLPGAQPSRQPIPRYPLAGTLAMPTPTGQFPVPEADRTSGPAQEGDHDHDC
jgi:hypothetical protein